MRGNSKRSNNKVLAPFCHQIDLLLDLSSLYDAPQFSLSLSLWDSLKTVSLEKREKKGGGSKSQLEPGVSLHMYAQVEQINTQHP